MAADMSDAPIVAGNGHLGGDGFLTREVIREGGAGQEKRCRKRYAADRGLLLGLGREEQRIALLAAGIGGGRGLLLCNVLGKDGDDTDTALMRRHHHRKRAGLGQAELALEHAGDEVARREIVVHQDHLVQAWPLDLQFRLQARGDESVLHAKLQ